MQLYLKDKKRNNLYIVQKFISPWTLSVPQASHFSSRFALGKLFASKTGSV